MDARAAQVASGQSTIFTMLGVITVYFGLAAVFLATVSLLRPLTFLAIRSRKLALVVLASGILMVVSGELLPARETGVSEPRTHLDDFMPAYQFNEFHSVRVKASREQVYRAIKSVTADEITFFRTLVWMRRMGRSGPESILNPPPGEPILDVATRTSFIVLAEEPDREIVLGTLVAAPPGWRPTGKATPAAFKALRKPGFALAAMNFRLDEDEAAPGTTIVTTETRVYATDADVCRRFGGYWRVIYPGSALIRRMWLRATVKRTQGARQPS